MADKKPNAQIGDKPKTEVIHIRVLAEDKEEFTRMAKQSGQSLTSYITSALRDIEDLRRMYDSSSPLSAKAVSLEYTGPLTVDIGEYSRSLKEK